MTKALHEQESSAIEIPKEGQCAGEKSPVRAEMEMHSLLTNSRDQKTTSFSFSKVGAILFIGLLLALCPRPVGASPTPVMGGADVFSFFPTSVTTNVGDPVEWFWSAGGHSSTSGPPGHPSGFWDSGILNVGPPFPHPFPAAGSF